MILHTVVPYELIFPTESSRFLSQKMVTYNGIPLLVQEDQQGYRIVRIMSSNPMDYMSQDMCPGEYLSM
ncbi:ribonuclease [Bacillus coahuilensis m2-6]|uniref:Ribonuclease n=1 Tax=Bacillus coahuilensis p1.1.43 TaxID=1150625 RepID=A0A147K9P8_9BACI|nr:YlzJ-like family protein [Bacillus coahuilensis]KUP07165.1 ribonuclease [Bacillus coahuilensis p1.1.43]KUP08718.1 ribonuclease [Bacillus coahuilensis m2-6]